MKNIVRVLLLVSTLALWIWATIVEPYSIDYDHTNITSTNWPKNLNGLKVALVSDIHYNGGALENWRIGNIIKKVNQAKPDIIILLGDYVQAGSRVILNLDFLSGQLKQLSAPLGVYAILGNHDSFYAHNLVHDMLVKSNIVVLENSNAKVSTPKGDFYLSAIADMTAENYFYTLAFKGIPQDAPVIFLSHTPDGFKYSPDSAKITFSGHTHGGQIQLPHIGAIFVNLRFDRIGEGKFQREGKTLYVTRGLGMSRVPIRFLCTPVITIATISKE